MGVGHAGIVIQHLHVGRNITVTPAVCVCLEGKQDEYICCCCCYPLDVWHIFAAVNVALLGLSAASSAGLTGLQTDPSRRGKRSLEAAGDAAAAAAFGSVETRDERGGGGGVVLGGWVGGVG